MCIACIVPWVANNSTRFARPVLLSTGMGAALYSGNCTPTYHGELLGYAEFGCVTFTGPTVDSDPSVAHGQSRTLPSTSCVRTHRAYRSSPPPGWDESSTSTARSNRCDSNRSATPTSGASARAHLLLGAPAGGGRGVVTARRRSIPVYPLLVFPATVVIATLFTIGTVRYRAPAEIPLVLLAAVALTPRSSGRAAGPRLDRPPGHRKFSK